MENSQSAIAAVFEEVDYDTYLLQGEQELRWVPWILYTLHLNGFNYRGGDPKRAIVYLSHACQASTEEKEEPYMLRSQCFTKLGMYEEVRWCWQYIEIVPSESLMEQGRANIITCCLGIPTFQVLLSIPLPPLGLLAIHIHRLHNAP